MCNFLHSGDKKAKRTKGIGYKCFRVGPGNKLMNLMIYTRWDIKYCLYTLQENDSLEWNKLFVLPSGNIIPSGFCFIPTKREAKKVMKQFDKAIPGLVVCHRIRFEGCVGRHLETAMFPDMPVETALCRKFTVLEKMEDKVIRWTADD